MQEWGSGSPILGVVGFAATLGVAPDELLRSAGLDPAFAATAEVSPSQRVRVWEEASRLSGDLDFGLHMAEWVAAMPEVHFDVLAFAVRSCATLGEHYQRMTRYVRLIHRDVYLSLEVEGDVARLAHGLRDDSPTPRHPAECMLTLALLQGRRAIGEEFAPREVCFTHARPARVTEPERVFQAPVRYGCPRNELVLDHALLARPQRQAEPRLLAVLERQLGELVRELPEGRSAVELIRRHVVDLLPGGEPTLAQVAARLCMSQRTLQRRLRDAGTSFAELVADARHATALSLLRTPRSSIDEVAFLLGFSDASAFRRAFKRRAGVTPAEYRRSGSDPADPRDAPS